MSEALQESEFRVERSTEVDPSEIIALRGVEAIGPDAPEVWQECLDQSLCTVIARDPSSQQLIGIGFVAGNARHAELVDLNVHPDYRQKGIARLIGTELLNYVNENNVPYVGLTYDKSQPWLADFYKQGGFEEIDFEMWLKRSIALADGSKEE